MNFKIIWAKQQSSILEQSRLNKESYCLRPTIGPCFPFAMNNYVYLFHLGHPTEAHPPASLLYLRQQREASGAMLHKKEWLSSTRFEVRVSSP